MFKYTFWLSNMASWKISRLIRCFSHTGGFPLPCYRMSQAGSQAQIVGMSPSRDTNSGPYLRKTTATARAGRKEPSVAAGFDRSTMKPLF